MNHLSSVKHVIVVLSGKGGVGKSTMAAQITLGLHAEGKKVGLLDLDLCGPSIPKIFNLEGRDVHQCSEGWLPVYLDQDQQVGVMSIGFLLDNKDDAVVWRGPKKNAMIRQFLSDVYWQGVDYLIIDTPPGTSDEHITVMEALRSFNPDGAVLVTTPQAVSVADVRRELTFCRKTGIPVLGLVENMRGYVCPHCSECTNIFSKGGGEALAKQSDIPFLGSIPIDRNLSLSMDQGVNFFTSSSSSSSPAVESLKSVVKRLMEVDQDLP